MADVWTDLLKVKHFMLFDVALGRWDAAAGHSVGLHI